MEDAFAWSRSKRIATNPFSWCFLARKNGQPKRMTGNYVSEPEANRHCDVGGPNSGLSIVPKQWRDVHDESTQPTNPQSMLCWCFTPWLVAVNMLDNFCEWQCRYKNVWENVSKNLDLVMIVESIAVACGPPNAVERRKHWHFIKNIRSNMYFLLPVMYMTSVPSYPRTNVLTTCCGWN